MGSAQLNCTSGRIVL